MTEPSPTIDVLMAAYNAAWSLPQALASIQAQTIQNIRIIVVDDGSTDDTADVLARAAAQDPRIVAITQPNRGIVEALNNGLSQCKAPLIARHDADDLSNPDRFEIQSSYLEANPDCVAVSGGAVYIDEQGELTGAHAKPSPPELADAGWVPAREPYLKQPFLMVRRESLLAVGGYRPFRVAEDSDLCWRLIEIGKLHNLQQSFGSYRVHARSISSTSTRSGRIIALCSQLAALSARRRYANFPDLEFRRGDDDDYLEAVSLDDFYAIGCKKLSKHEYPRLRLSMAAKLIEICHYRDFEPDKDDARFIQAAVRDEIGLVEEANRVFLLDSIMVTALRLAGKGHVIEAILLLPRQRWPVLAARLAFRFGLPEDLRVRLKKAVRTNPLAGAGIS